jgi:hypothetical protein
MIIRPCRLALTDWLLRPILWLGSPKSHGPSIKASPQPYSNKLTAIYGPSLIKTEFSVSPKTGSRPQIKPSAYVGPLSFRDRYQQPYFINKIVILANRLIFRMNGR